MPSKVVQKDDDIPVKLSAEDADELDRHRDEERKRGKKPGTLARVNPWEPASESPSRRLEQVVEVRKSKICDGVGLFALKPIARGSYITNYAGKRLAPHEASASDYVYSCSLDGTSLDGSVPGRDWWKYGVAHLANDAIDPSVSGGRDNNVAFTEVKVPATDRYGGKNGFITRVYLKAERDIEAGEEILVSYGLKYWAWQAKNSPEKLPADTIKKILVLDKERRSKTTPHAYGGGGGGRAKKKVPCKKKGAKTANA